MKLCPSLPVCFIFNAHIIFKAYLPFCFLLKRFQDKTKTPQNFFWSVFLSRRLPIFTRRFQRTILGTSELNFCVRNGNRWNLTVIVTDQYDWFSITFLFYLVQCFLKDVPSKLNNHCSHFVIDLRIQANCGQALDLLVHTCWMDRSTYTSCLSTS